MIALGALFIFFTFFTIAVSRLLHRHEKNRQVAENITIVMIAIFAATLFVQWSTNYRDDRWVTCTVIEKYQDQRRDDYWLYTSDCGKLINDQSFLRGKFDAVGTWVEIPEEGKVELRIAGTSIPFLDTFPNIFDVREVEP